MKVITKTDKRKVTVTDTSEGIRIDEGSLFLKYGYSRLSWDSSCVILDLDELRKILAFAEGINVPKVTTGDGRP